MPLYTYQKLSTGETIDIIQSMNDVHEYHGENGNEKDWIRIFHIPQASIDTKQDPFSSNEYLNVTKNKKGTYGDLLNYSQELSNKRADIAGGSDPIKENYYKNYSKQRRGAKHPDKIQKTFENKHIKVEL
jgi:hypothetical protein